jgi:hypothetical protein
VTKFLEPTRERFLLAIAAQLPAERFIELHFFHPMRQGGIESGVAVIAAHPESRPEIIVADAPRDDMEELGDPRADKAPRYTVYTARYKLALKGLDRGKWECGVVAEADAPLVTVESVVRGVQRRSGDPEPAERMSGDEARDYVLAATR